MPLIRGLPRITPAQPMQKRAPDGSESDSGWQIVTHISAPCLWLLKYIEV